jgi:fatty-acyl-CoA synthase
MAALMLDSGVSFSPEAFYKYAETRLPAYARPGFLRVVPTLEVTGTYKLKKTELQKAAFDPKMVKDPLFVRHESNGGYLPVTPQVFADIQAQKLRL